MLIPAGEENLRISGNFPEGVTATAKKVEINLNDIDGKMEVLVAYDIVLYDRDGQEWQPKEAVVVSFVDEKISQKQAKGDTLEVYHLSDEYLSETEEVSLTQEDLIQSEKVETVASTSEEEVSFVTEHFSVYVIVSVTDYIPSQTCLAQVKADYGYYFSNEASESSKIGVEYLTNQEALETSYTGFSFTGLLKTSTVENADRFYLEFDGDTVYPYTYLAGQKKYLNFVPYTAHILPSTGDDAELYLTDTKYPFSLTVVEGEECKYYLKHGNFYLNKHKSSLGNVFA